MGEWNLKTKTLFIQTQTEIIPKNWELVELQQISKIIDSLHVTPKYSSKGIPMVRASDIKTGNLELENTFCVSNYTYEKFTKNYKPRRNDIVMSRVGTYFPNSFVEIDQPFCLGQNTVVIHPLINSRFLYYALNSRLVQGQIDELLVGSGGQKTISLEDIREVLILKPKDSVEIERFAKILYDLDTKIQNLQNQNKVLEQIAQAIFKSWFVNFDGITKFEDSELGEIPIGWKIKKLGDFVDVEKGLSYKGKFLSKYGIPLINLGNFKFDGGFNDDKIKYYTGEHKEKHLVKVGDLLVANTDITQDRVILGSPIILPPFIKSEKILFTHHVFAIRNCQKLGKYFSYQLLQTNSYKVNATSYATGTTVLAISKDALLYFKFVYPNPVAIEKFERISELIYNIIFKYQEKIMLLKKIHNSLLPKLMSGEIQVKN